MKPVDQRRIDADRGDCMTAALASLLEIPYEAVPLFREHEAEGAEWFTEYFAFLKSQGYEFVGTFQRKRTDGTLEPWSDLRERCEGVHGFYMAGVPSPRYPGIWHAIIIDGEGRLVHDPHPSRAGGEIDHVDMIQPLSL